MAPADIPNRIAETPWRGVFTVLMTGTGEPVGLVHIGPYRTGEIELSYEFVPEVWGRGIAREACGPVLAWAQREVTNGEPVIAVTQAANDRSMALLRSLGMTERERFEEFAAEQVLMSTAPLPSRRFRAVLDLGEGVGTLPPLPRSLGRPELDADIDDESSTLTVYLHFPTGQLHADVTEDRFDHHFHDARGNDIDRSPWKREPTAALLEWAQRFALMALPVMPDLLDDAEDAAEWYAAGLTVYARDTCPVPLEIIEVELEGELMLLPWLGSGTVDHEHIDGDDHPIELLWDPLGGEPSIRIARAWLDARTDQPRTVAEPGVDWNAVGLSASEVLSWLEGVYLNHHVLAHPAQVIMRAALERIAGLR